MTELEKYQGIYSHQAYAFYGHSNHGAKATAQVEARLQRSGKTAVVDVGCGWNEWVNQWNAGNPHSQAIGVDFACPGADIRAVATKLPFPTKSAGVVTSFDMLEHLAEDEVPQALAEFARVAEAFVFSISHVPSRVKWKGETLHPTVRPRDWWLAQIVKAGGHHICNEDGFVSGQWGNPVWQPDLEARVVVVGNGPSVLAQPLGEQIDAFDEVIRFNRYQLRGFERHTGTRTTLWSTFGHGYLPGDEDQRPARMIFVYGERGEPAYPAEEMYRIPKAYYKDLQQRVHSFSQRPADRKPTGMSSGCLVLHWLLEVVGLEKVVFTGFDHFRKDFSSQHHYYNPKAYGRPPELDGDAEAALLAPYAQAGRMVPLTVDSHTKVC
jgi:hypothetical protein